MQDHALSQQQARGDYNAANNKMIGGKKWRKGKNKKMRGGAGEDNIQVPSPPGVSETGQNEINKLVVSSATSEALSKYDKVGGTRKKYKKKSKRRRKRSNKKSK